MKRRWRQRLCTRCGTVPVAFSGVEVCFGCWPGGPVTPPPCLRCGSRREYYTSGVCARCHPAARPAVDSCLDCLAWGATPTHGWLCHGCDSWRRVNPTVAACPICGRVLHLGVKYGVCRLCYKQASMLRDPNESLDIVAANRHGQQLFLADLFFRRGVRRPDPMPERPPEPLPLEQVRPRYWQPVLFEMRRDLATHGRPGMPEPPDPRLAAALYRHARELAAEQGWSEKLTGNTCHGLRIILGFQDQPGAPVRASDVEQLRGIDLPIWTVLRVLGDAKLLEEDRTPALDGWVARQIDGLPEPMAGELRLWYEVMKHGSPVPPRRKPRSETTIRIHLGWALPTLRTWAAAGHSSLREITKEQVLDALPPAGNPRSTAGQGLKAIFRVLKARKVIFIDPTRRVKTGEHARRQPLPANLDAIRAALHGDDPLRAVLVALIAFHGLRTGQLCRVRLTDICDGRLRIDGRGIVLADPVRERLAAWLEHRGQRWPHTSNPYLFIHRRTVGRAEPVGRRWIWLHLGPDLSAAAIREDRILNEAHATGGDLRRLADLFGLSVQAGARYAATVDHPDLVRLNPPSDDTPGGS